MAVAVLIDTARAIHLPPPVVPSLLLADDANPVVPLRAWVDQALGCPDWPERAEFLIRVITENMIAYGGVGEGDVYPFALSLMLTATLESLDETEIATVEAAALYALTERPEWRAAALAWLEPVQDAAFRSWRDARPRYRGFAAAIAWTYELPLWLADDASRRSP